MVPGMSNGTHDGTEVVPKLPDIFYFMINFHHFEGPKNGPEATLTIILTIVNFHLPIMSNPSDLSRNIHLPTVLQREVVQNRLFFRVFASIFRLTCRTVLIVSPA